MRRRLFTVLIRAVIGFVLFAALSAITTWAYYRFMPGDWFLNYYSAHADNTVVGQPVSLTLCRKTHAKNLKIEATRTFVYQQKDGRFQPVAEYTFAAHIEDGEDPCQTVQLGTSRQPQIAGSYRIQTEAEYYVQGNRKTISYSTNVYQVTDTAESLEKQINELRLKIDQLEARLKELSSRPVQESTSTGLTTTPNSSPARAQPTTSTGRGKPSQPKPTQPQAQPSQRGVRDLINRVLGPLGIHL